MEDVGKISVCDVADPDPGPAHNQFWEPLLSVLKPGRIGTFLGTFSFPSRKDIDVVFVHVQ